MDVWTACVFLICGTAAGFLNVVAGGGSLLIMPLLIFLGLPETVANGTGRIAILTQNLSAMWRFHQSAKIPYALAKRLLPPTLVGSALGAFAGVFIDDGAFRHVLAGIMLCVALWITFDPISHVHHAAEAHSEERLRARWTWPLFLIVGFYGGMIQAGVGYVALAALMLGLRRPLLEANILKIILVGAYTPVAIAIFLGHGKIHLPFALLLAVGQSIGGWLGAHATLKRGEKAIRAGFVVVLVLTGLKLVLDR